MSATGLYLYFQFCVGRREAEKNKPSCSHWVRDYSFLCMGRQGVKREAVHFRGYTYYLPFIILNQIDKAVGQGQWGSGAVREAGTGSGLRRDEETEESSGGMCVWRRSREKRLILPLCVSKLIHSGCSIPCHYSLFFVCVWEEMRGGFFLHHLNIVHCGCFSHCYYH